MSDKIFGITVKIDDQASAGLSKLGAKLSETGGAGKGAFDNLTTAAKDSRQGIEAASSSNERLVTSSSKVASQYAGLTASIQTHRAEVSETDRQVSKLIDRYDPLGARLRRLQEDFKALDAAAKAGRIASRDDARVDQVYTAMQQQMNASSASAAKFSDSTKSAALSAGQLRMATQQLPMQFTDIWVSLAAGQSPMMVLLQQGTQIKDSFGGMGSAARALGGYVFGLINPFTLAASAAMAGGAAWYYWGREAESAADKAVAAAEKIISGMRATDSVYVLQRERDALAKKIPVQWLSYDEKQLEKLDSDSQKLIAEYKKIDKSLKTEVERSGREWESMNATDAERKAAALRHEKQLYGEQVALAKGNSDRLIELERQHRQKVAAINSEFEKKGAPHPPATRKDPLDSGMEGINQDLFRAQMEVLGVPAEQVKVYELALKGEQEAQRLVTEGNLKGAEALRVSTQERVTAAQASADRAMQIRDESAAQKEATRQEEERKKKAHDLILSVDPQAKVNAQFQQLLELKPYLNDEQFNAAVKKMYADLGYFKQGGKDTFAELTQAVQGWGKQFTDTFAQMAMTGKFNFGQLANSILSDLMRIVVQTQITQPLLDALFAKKGAASGGGGSLMGAAVDFFSGLFNANGNAFTGSSVAAFANGGTFTNQLFNQPTAFQFANGGGFNLGIMGEAGPEAVMPLTRTRGGQLGVRAEVANIGSAASQIAANDGDGWRALAAGMTGIAAALTLGLGQIGEAYAGTMVKSTVMSAQPVGALIPSFPQQVAMLPAMPPSIGGPAGRTPGSITINLINAPAGTQVAQQRTTQDANGNMTLDLILEQVENGLARNVQRGSGQLSSALEGVYGLNRSAGSVN